MRVAIVSGLIACCCASTAFGQSGDDSDDSALLVAEARRAIADKDYDRAGDLLDRAIDTNARRIDAYVLRASVHAIHGQYDDGIRLLRRARALAPNNADVETALGTQLMAVGKAAEAVPILEAVVATKPQRYEAHGTLGRYYVKSREWSKAVTALEAYLHHRPESLAADDAVHVTDLANAHLRLGDADLALSLFNRALDANPASKRARIGLAWASAAVDCRSAMAVLRGVEDLADDYPHVWVVRSLCHSTLGEVDRAIEFANRAIEALPDDAGAHAALAAAQVAGADLDGARTSLQKAVALAGRTKHILELARLERLAGEPALAVARLTTRVPAATHRLWRAWHLELAEAHLAAKQGAEALAVSEVLVADADADADTYTVYGASLLAMNRTDDAIEAFERALILDPASTRARELSQRALHGSATVAIEAGQWAEAEQILARADGIARTEWTALNLGLARLHLGDAASAVEPLRHAASSGWYAEGLLGHALATLGQHHEAIRVLSSALAQPTTREPARAAPIALELAASLVETGDPARAADELKPYLGTRDASLRQRVVDGYMAALRMAATAAIEDARFTDALALLERADNAVPSDRADIEAAVLCDIVLAATAGGFDRRAISTAERLEARGGACNFANDEDGNALAVLRAVNEGRDVDRAAGSLAKLKKYAKAKGVVGDLARSGIETVANAAASRYFERGKTRKARDMLRAAKAAVKRPSPETRHNLAIVDLAAGRVDAAIKALLDVEASVPVAVVHLGVAYDEKGEPATAMKYYRKALETRGVDTVRVQGWIDRKLRVFGSSLEVP